MLGENYCALLKILILLGIEFVEGSLAEKQEWSRDHVISPVLSYLSEYFRSKSAFKWRANNIWNYSKTVQTHVLCSLVGFLPLYNSLRPAELSKNKTTVSGNATSFGRGTKTGFLRTYFLKIGQCSVISMESYRQDLLNYMAAHGSILKNRKYSFIVHTRNR